MLRRKLRCLAFAGSFLTLAGGMINAAQAEEAKAKEGEFWNTGTHFQLTGEVVHLTEDGIHDPFNTAVAGILQQPVEAMGNFPRDNAGIIDWVKTLESGMIAPRSDVSGEAAPLKPLDLDIIYKETGAMPYVKFPHRAHTMWLTCSNCHPDLFAQKKGSVNIQMADVLGGKYCGLCHGKVAFPPTKNCVRCHSVEQDKKK